MFISPEVFYRQMLPMKYLLFVYSKKCVITVAGCQQHKHIKPGKAFKLLFGLNYTQIHIF